MLISMRTKNGDLIVKDYLDIDFNMRIKENPDAPKTERYEVWINSKYRFADGYPTKEKAEDQMLKLMDTRNELEVDISDLI